MLAGISCMSSSHMPTTMTKAHVPQVMRVPARASSSAHATYPTHVLAVTSSKGSGNEHASFSQCTTSSSRLNALRFPVSRPPLAHRRARSTSPVVPLALPPLQQHSKCSTDIYTRTASKPCSHRSSPSLWVHAGAVALHRAVDARVRLAAPPAQHVSVLGIGPGGLTALTGHAAHVKELWQDMVALGLHDPELWDTLDLAWEITLGALNIAASNH